MAPLPVIANVVRCDLNWNSPVGPSPHSTFHIATNSDDLPQIGLDIGSAFDDADGNCWASLYSGIVATQILLTPLDGVTAGQNVLLGTTLEGDATGGTLTNTAAVLSFRTLQRGPRGRGRIFIGPTGESEVDDSVIATGIRSSNTTAWNSFNDELAGSSSAASLVVASYVHAQAGAVTSISMRASVGTMHRRQRRVTG